MDINYVCRSGSVSTSTSTRIHIHLDLHLYVHTRVPIRVAPTPTSRWIHPYRYSMQMYVLKSRTWSSSSLPSLSPAPLLASSPGRGPCPSLWLSGVRASCLCGTCHSHGPWYASTHSGKTRSPVRGWCRDWVSCKVRQQEAFQRQMEAD